MKNLMCQFGTETNTFAKGYMEFEQQAPCGWIRADAIVTADTPGLHSDPRLFSISMCCVPSSLWMRTQSIPAAGRRIE